MFDGNSGVSPASLPVMRSEDEIRSRSAGEVESRALWVLMAAGLFLLAAAALSGESGPTVSRTDRFQATLAPGATVRVENVNGDVVASRGSAFSAVVTTNVTARDRSRAEEILNRTKILQSNEGLGLRAQDRTGRRRRDIDMADRSAGTVASRRATS
jgi:hypothetical protein